MEFGMSLCQNRQQSFDSSVVINKGLILKAELIADITGNRHYVPAVVSEEHYVRRH